MEPKLTIKHLSAYLPYKLILEHPNLVYTGNPPEPSHEEMTHTTLTPENLQIHLKGYSMPLLHPLDRLTRTINHNGEYHNMLNYIEQETDFSVEDIVGFCKRGSLLLNIDYEFAMTLIKLQFDVFNLIPQGLALPKQEA